MTDAVAYKDASRPAGERVEDLLGRMRIEEKLAQLGGVWSTGLLDGDRFSEAKARDVLAHGTGHVTRIATQTLLGPLACARVVNDIQAFLVEHTRLGVPAIVHEESCAGFTARGATQFPQAIGLASTWDPGLMRAVATVVRTQMRAVGARQTLAPVLDIARDPRWGRTEETFGEDPYLVSRLGVAYVEGIQGEALRQGVAATGKHFAGYGMSEGGLNWAPSPLPSRELFERILPPFRAAIREAGLASIMNGYQEIDGIPCGASKWLLGDLLRGELGFEGVVVSDYYAVVCLATYHRIAADSCEAAARALAAGIDVELPQLDCYAEPLKQALATGRVATAAVDRAVARVLRLKFDLGLFEDPFVDAEAAPAVFDTPEQRALARRAATESLVLLKNEGALLPLAPTLRRLAVIGPSADSVRHLQGDYHYPTHLELVYGAIDPEEIGVGDRSGSPVSPGSRREAVDLADFFTPSPTVLESIRALVSEETEIRFERGCAIQDSDASGIAAAVAAARDADAAIVVVGGRSGLVRGCTSGEANDRADVALAGVQAALVEAVARSGTPTVVVLINGRPLALTNIVESVPAILEAWLPGEEGGPAVAAALFGEASPSGRLPVTLPRAVGQLPLYYNHKPSGARSQFWGDYADLPTAPLFPFGHGLTYTRFAYEVLTLRPERPAATDTLEIAFDLTNVGGRDGEEVAQLYVRDRVASVTRPVAELKGFARIPLRAGESRRVTFSLDLRQLAFYDTDMNHVVEPGEIELWVGGSSADRALEASVELTGASVKVDPGTVRPTGVSVK